MRSSQSTVTLALLCAALVSAGTTQSRFSKVRRDDNWSDHAHCPGGSIGDADKCTFEVTQVYDTPLKRWTQFGSWYDNCDSTDTASIVATVTDSVAVGNSFEESTSLNVGLESEGISIGLSQSFSQSWSTTKTSSEAESITVLKGQAGNINLADNFYLSTGNLKINYGSRKGGHYIWYEEGIDVFTAVGDGDTYSANVADCGKISQPSKGTWYYNNSDYDAVKAGISSSYTYED